MAEKEFNVMILDKNEKIIFEIVLGEEATDNLLNDFRKGRNIGTLGNDEIKLALKTSEIRKIIAGEVRKFETRKRITIRFTNGEEIHFTDDNLLYKYGVVLQDYESDNKVLRIEMQNGQDIILNKNAILYINICDM